MKLRGGYLCVLGLWFLVPQDVAASLVPAVVAAAICHCEDVAASLVPTVAAGGICVYLDVAGVPLASCCGQLDQLRYWNETTAYKTDVCILPKLLDERVATMHLPVLGAASTRFLWFQG